MAFVNASSCECGKSELDLFAVQPTQTSVEEACVVEYQPVSSVQNRAPLDFDVPGSGEHYIDLANIQLYIRAKILNADGVTPLDVNNTVAPVNLMLHSMFSQVDISLNGTLISSSTNTYPYRAMLETLLSYGEDAKKSQLTSELFYKDDAGEMDTVIIAAGGGHQPNAGLQSRRALARESREFDMVGRIHADIFFQERYLLNEVGVKVRLVRSKDSFCLMGAPNDAKLHITHAALFVRKVKLSPSVFIAHARALENGTAKYPIKRTVCKAFAIPQNYRDITYEKLVSGQLPTRLVIGIVNNTAFNGSRTLNPFNFHHYNLSEIAIYLDGHQQHTLKPIQPDFGAGLFVRAYNTLFSGTGKLNGDEGIAISRSDYDRGYALYAFDLTADLGEDDHFNLVKHGNLRVALKFAEALPHPVTVIAYAEFDNVIELDRDRNVLVDFGV